MGYGFGNRIAVGRRAITAQAQAEQVIWKVAVYGAGTASSNGEYVWDGNELQDGKPVYRNGSNTISFGDFGGASAEWGIYDDSAGDNTYLSSNLIAWSINGGSSPAPSSALSYAQDSYFNFTLVGADPSTSNGTTLQSVPPANDFWFISETGNPSNITGEIYLDNGLYYIYDISEDAPTFTATSVLGNWSAVGTGITPPTISSVVYSA